MDKMLFFCYHYSMANFKNNVSIFRFFNYREYLTEVYLWKKKNQKGFSYRLLAAEAGFKSANYIQRVISGKRNLSFSQIEPLITYLKFSKDEVIYLKTLILFNHATSGIDKQIYLNRLLKLREIKGKLTLEDEGRLYFSKWYHPVIRELAALNKVGRDYKKMGELCIPKISEENAKDAIDFLLKNNFLKWTNQGVFEQSSPILTTGNEVSQTFIREYHRTMLFQSQEALDKISPEDRDISALTLSVSKETYNNIKQEIQDFRKRLLAMAKDDDNPEMVCFTGFQLLPKVDVEMLENK